jgi:Cu/Ag efflux pump CusA
MRVWMDPERLTSLGLTADDVVTAIRQQNIQAAAGAIGTAPGKETSRCSTPCGPKGRLNARGFQEHRRPQTNAQGGVVRLRDVARVELGAQSYSANSTLNGAPAVNMAIYRSAGANALETVTAIEAELKRLSQRFPEGVQYRGGLRHHQVRALGDPRNHADPDDHLHPGGGVTFLFLQDWRATLIPTLTIPVSLWAPLRPSGPGYDRQHPHPLRPDPGHRPGGGRRHRGGRERPAGDVGRGLGAPRTRPSGPWAR